KADQVSWLRLFIFLAGAVLAGWFFYEGNNLFGFGSLVIFYAVFIVVMRWHNRLQYTRDHNRILSEINREEIMRLNGELKVFDAGDRFKDAQHPYTSDLDIFGPHSLFAVLNRGVTSLGKNQLAAWLQTAAPAPEIIARQEVLQEIAPEVEWRQELQANARHYLRKVEKMPDLLQWLEEPEFFKGKKWLIGLTFLLPILTLAAIAGWYYDLSSGYWVGGLALAQYLINIKYAAQKESIREKSDELNEELRSYVSVLEHLEKREYKSAKLMNLRQELFLQQSPASGFVKGLSSLLDFLAVTQNAYMNFLLNNLLMWDFFWLWRLDIWKQSTTGNLERILHTVAEAEALASLAAFAFANPDNAMPQISAEPFEVAGTEIGHPLIFAETRISNSFATAGPGKTVIITGSNMSGKSTFLRTVGINMALTFAGSVVSAKTFKAYPIQLFTAMRTEDNLAESTSSFYAELKRLKMLLDLTEKGTPVFYFLDEILKGTNSRDRHLGAVALVKQLHQRSASGFISTHDLELGQLENEMPQSVSNYSFNSTIEGDKIIFDYRLQPGLCRSFNASKLMQLMGIAIAEG
ncbi:MAG TPA: hypothetical protein VK927_01850, partial [Adhaeribacter sp.]|nr:hypothetical protein [Adhaeribacter sp.]